MAEQEKAEAQNQQNGQSQKQPEVDPEFLKRLEKYPWIKELYEITRKPDTDPLRNRLRELSQKLADYCRRKLAEHGDKPTPRSPNFNDPKWRKKWEIFGFLDPVPWFWNIPDNLPPHIKMRRKLMKELYWREALATPEELAEYRRMVREISKLHEELAKRSGGVYKIARYPEGTIIGYLM